MHHGMNSRVLLHSLIKLCKKNSLLNSGIYRTIYGNGSNRKFFHTTTNSVIFEIGNGVGGSEAMLFADDMLCLYTRYLTYMRWPYQIIEENKSEAGGIILAKLLVTGNGTLQGLAQEAGVHRVQRVPKTERYGRIHTSTVAVTVLPKSVIDIKLNDRDLEFTTKRSTGPGGQHVNKTESAVRLLHKPTGMAVESQESKRQIDNRKTAMKKLLSRLQELEMEKITSQSASLKKSQVGRADRNEKIRTYNFPQDRITDHRIGKSYYNLKSMFAGDVGVLAKIIDDFNS